MMKLIILYTGKNIEDVQKWIDKYFEQSMRIIRMDLSIFEQYEIRPTSKFVPKIWEYRIVVKNGSYNFGLI